jgi:GT2 family glycosyltransferase
MGAGLFDDRFFAYFEDVDLSLRIAFLGWRGIYVPQALARHRVSATANRIGGFKRFFGSRNAWLLLVKDLPGVLWPVVLPRFIAVQVTWLRSALRHGELRPAMRGYLAALAATPALLRSRREIQRGRQLSGRELWLRLESTGLVEKVLRRFSRRGRRGGASEQQQARKRSLE